MFFSSNPQAQLEQATSGHTQLRAALEDCANNTEELRGLLIEVDKVRVGINLSQR